MKADNECPILKMTTLEPRNIVNMDSGIVQIESSWLELLEAEFEKPYFDEIRNVLKTEESQGEVILPPSPLIFNAFHLTPVDKVKVVILGQDPYHKAGQAMGLSFSVPKGVTVPPSLRNIYKELEADLDIPRATHGDLTLWAKQGVLMLNAMLTVRAGSAGSHAKIGWQQFTDAVIRKLSDHKKGLVFLLWGNFAKGKSVLIDEANHHVLKAAHPSPLARNAFSGCKHFSKTNKLLSENGYKEINWSVN